MKDIFLSGYYINHTLTDLLLIKSLESYLIKMVHPSCAFTLQEDRGNPDVDERSVVDHADIRTGQT